LQAEEAERERQRKETEDLERETIAINESYQEEIQKKRMKEQQMAQLRTQYSTR